MQEIKNKLTKRGDTFVEVCFALAIFSFLAVLAIGSMNQNLSTVQSTLEAEVSRSELDAQTEAVRYIHEAFIGGRNTGRSNNLVAAWETITDKAISPSAAQEINNHWPPKTCEDFYKSYKSNMMIVNTRNISNENSDDIVEVAGTGDLFREAPVIPQLIYDKDTSNLTTADNVKLKNVEGIWFYAVRGDSNNNSDDSDFYDIYIQSCWYAMDSSTPRTLDTVIRLYDPTYVDNIATHNYATTDYKVIFDANGGYFPPNTNNKEYVVYQSGASRGFSPVTKDVPEPKYDPLKFQGWSMDNKYTYNPNTNLSYNSENCASKENGVCVIKVYAIWSPWYRIQYEDSGTVAGTIDNMPNPSLTEWQESPKFSTPTPTIEATDNYCYKFAGWSRSKNGTIEFPDPGNITLSDSDRGKTTTLYTRWQKVPCGEYKIKLTWAATPKDLDSHIKVNINGRTLHTYYGNKNSELSNGSGTLKVSLARDITSGYGPEETTITVNDLANFNSIFYVYNWSGSPALTASSAKVEVTNASGIKNTYSIPTAGTGRYWRVFTIQNRRLIPCTSSCITSEEPNI